MTQIGKYHIERELGRGGMGVVYRAFDPVVERTVAIKTIRLDVENAAELVERLKREAKSVGQLEHPNVVTLYDAGEAAGVFFLAMQFIQGETLQDRINRQKWFGWKETYDLMRQISAGLGYAHERGVIHRDIKPANIMITPEGVVKLTDFGIAKLADTGASSSGLVIGTPSYMSPEQALGKSVDARSDIFSLGSILYELTTAEKAFPGQNATTIIYKIVHESPIPVTTLQPGLDPALDAIVLRALAKSPETRFHSCREFAQALESYTNQMVAAVPKTSVMPTPVPRKNEIQPGSVPAAMDVVGASASVSESQTVPSQPKVHLLWLGIGALAALLVIAAVIIFTQFKRPAPAPEAAAPAGVSAPPTSAAPSSTAPQPVEKQPPAVEPTKTKSVQREPTRRQSTPSETRSSAARNPLAEVRPAVPAPLPDQPETFDSLILKGDLAFQKGHYQEALDAYTKAHNLNPRDRSAKRKLSLVLTLLGRPEEARQVQ